MRACGMRGLTASVLGWAAATAQAGEILGNDRSVAWGGPGLGLGNVVAFGRPRPKNDPDKGKVNFLSMDLRFDAVDYIELDLPVANAGTPRDEYWFESHIQNWTGVNLTGMRVELGFLRGRNFVKSRAADMLDFDWSDRRTDKEDPPINPTNQWGAITWNQDDLLFDKGERAGLADRGQGTIFYVIDVPDFDANSMPYEAKTEGGYRFTLRFTPIPEPASGLLLALGALSAAARRWLRAG